MGDNEKRSVGRPSKLSECFDKAKEYLLGGFSTFGDVIPNVAGLSCYLGVSRSTIYKWAEENDEFSDILEGVLSLQENKLINSGLKGEFNPTLVKLMLSKHGYADKQETELTGKDGGAIHIETSPMSTLFGK